MVQIKTMKNPLVTDKDKDAFCFRSKCSQTLTEKQLAKEMAAYNSSFTEADNIGILNVLNTVVIKHLSKGYSVELPFGSIRPNATGTCSSIQDSFSLGHGNNQVNIIFSLSDEAKKEIDSVVDTLKRDRVSIENQKVQLEDYYIQFHIKKILINLKFI